MWPNAQEPADLVTFTEEIRKGKLHFLCRVGNPYIKEVFVEASVVPQSSKLKLLLRESAIWFCFMGTHLKFNFIDL